MAANRAVSAFFVAAGLAAAVWALSVPITGRSEPWDANGLYYVIALVVAGALSGALVPRHLGAHYVGAVAGQAIYELLVLDFGALFVLGLVFLMGYSIIFAVAAAIVAFARKRGSHDGGAVEHRTSGPDEGPGSVSRE
jgi:hypothetical protein